MNKATGSVRRSLLSLFVAVGSLAAFTSCGVGQNDDGTAPESGDVAAASQGLTTPPAGSGGFTLVGNYRFKNGQGYCMQRSGNVVSTATCSTSAEQVFAAYRDPNGLYNLCVPNSLVLGAVDYDLWVNSAYVATCIEQKDYTISSSSTDLRIYSGVPLSEKPNTTFIASGGRIRDEGAGILGWFRNSKKLTRNSAGVVVLGSYSGNADQKWTPIAVP